MRLRCTCEPSLGRPACQPGSLQAAAAAACAGTCAGCTLASPDGAEDAANGKARSSRAWYYVSGLFDMMQFCCGGQTWQQIGADIFTGDENIGPPGWCVCCPDLRPAPTSKPLM
jgi:hypothetical protein